MSEIGVGLEAVMMMAALSVMNRKRKDLSPEDAAKRAEREAIQTEALYEAQYKQAHLDNEEYNRSPRAFRRRLTLSKGDK